MEAVRAFYERHPYPAPLGNLDRYRELYRNPDRRRATSLLLWPSEKPRTDREILVAGCGTSQAAIHALRQPDARVTAIDISEVGLRHTRELQKKYGLTISISIGWRSRKSGSSAGSSTDCLHRRAAPFA